MGTRFQEPHISRSTVAATSCAACSAPANKGVGRSFFEGRLREEIALRQHRGRHPSKTTSSMKKAKMTVVNAQPIAREEWDFSSCPEDEALFCRRYEYSRHATDLMEEIQ